MTLYVDRTVTELGRDSGTKQEPKALQDYADSAAYVLLGAPGSGKTTEFRKESEQREDSTYVTARDFAVLPVQKEWKGKTLFIDGLDEMRVHRSSDLQQPLDQVRAKLDELGLPRFRLSCREADWLGRNDQEALARLLGSEELALLRLNPLCVNDISVIAEGRNAGNFVQEAGNRGLTNLLENPLTLNLLLGARENNEWPDTLSETFHLGCEQLSKEFNIEHQVGSASAISTDDLLSEAGRLCAVILLAGLDGILIRGNSSAEEIPLLNDLSGVNQELPRAVVGTLLFEVNNNVARPRHRQIAEYLAAKYLAQRIEEGFSATRVLAVLTDNDSRVVAPLRGLAAWLAALCPKLRPTLMRRDPVGVVSYGDVKDYSFAEKQELISNLEEVSLRDPWTLAKEADDVRWGFLATSDMEEPFRECLVDAPSSESKRWLSYALLDALSHAPPLPGLMPVLLDILRTNAYPVELKTRAFEAFTNQYSSPQADCELTRVLDDLIENSKLSGRARLSDFLLTELYPRHLSASELPKYLILSQPDAQEVELSYFWELHVLRESEASQLSEILDALAALKEAEKISGSVPITGSEEFCDLFYRLLAGLLEKGGPADKDKLYDWLRVATENYEPNHDFQQKFLAWVHDHPEVYEVIVRRTVAQSEDPDWDVHRVLHGAQSPKDYAIWCLEAACKERDAGKVDFYIRQACRYQDINRSGQEGFSKIAEETLADHPLALERYRSISEQETRTQDTRQHEEHNRTQRREEYFDERRQNRRDTIKQHQAALEANQGAPKLLDRLAKVYGSRASGIHGDTPVERLSNYLGDDNALVGLVFKALRDTPKREDLPAEEKILKLIGTDQQYFVTHPYLAGLQECIPLEGQMPNWFDEREMRRALAFYLSTLPLDAPELCPVWYRRLVKDFPSLVANMFVEVAKRFLASRLVDFPRVYELSKEDHKEVAELVIMSLLRKFPLQVRSEKLYVLSGLMEIAFRLVDSAAVLDLVEAKLALNSLRPNQRVYWLCLGMALDGDAYLESMGCLFSGKSGQRLLPHLTEFLSRFKPFQAGLSNKVLSVEAKKLLIGILGPGYLMDWFRNLPTALQRQVTGSRVVENLIKSLEVNSESEAKTVLGELAADDSLQNLRNRLEFATEAHRLSFPESGFEHLNLESALEFLQERAPAIVADLMAITGDSLDELRDEIRNGDTSDWRQYWDGISGQTQQSKWKPLDETLCRDRFLSDLRRILPSYIQAEPEVQHADDKQADVRVSCADMEVPVEFKRSQARDLWTAIRDQLIPRYTRSPGAKGCGIFVVFWFGAGDCKVAPNGSNPATAEELEKKIQATLSDDEACKILARVIDVSRPP